MAGMAREWLQFGYGMGYLTALAFVERCIRLEFKRLERLTKRQQRGARRDPIRNTRTR